jgi:hypothetical protein
MSSDSETFETETDESGVEESGSEFDDNSEFDPNDEENSENSEEDSEASEDDEGEFDPNIESDEDDENDSDQELSDIETTNSSKTIDLIDISNLIPPKIVINNFLTQTNTNKAPTNTFSTNIEPPTNKAPTNTFSTNIEPPTNTGSQSSGQTLTQLSEQLQNQKPEPAKRTILPTIDRDLVKLEKAVKNPEVKVVLSNLEITGNIDVDLKRHINESELEFDTRSKITRALVISPYNVNIKAALIAGKIWCQKALYGVVYSEDIELALREIQQRAS